MKKNILSLIFGGAMIICGYSQSWTSGSGILYANPTTTRIGIGLTYPTELFHVNGGALKIGNTTSATDRAVNMLKFGDGNYVQIGEWEADDLLSFKATRYNFTNGNVGIGTNNPSSKLHVNGSLYSTGLTIGHNVTSDWHYGVYISVSRDYTKALGVIRSDLGKEMFCIMGNGVTMIKKLNAESIEVRPDAMQCYWYDYVFSRDYKLLPLKELEIFIREKQHLPDIPSEAEVQENGINVFEMNALLLKKIEELTLYIIDMEKRISDMESKKEGGKQ